MHQIIEIISQHAHHAHWFVFIGIVLAGFNIPLSADLLVLMAAFLAATVIPEHTWLLFGSVLLGCYISAMCAYWTGRLLGPLLNRVKFLNRLINPQRLAKIKLFYDKYGLWTLVIGRFIPFGVRNCVFMSSGASKVHFGKFILMDAIACSLWSSACFYSFFTLGQNRAVIWEYLKTFNLVIFTAFSVTVIGFIWYKIVKKAKAPTP